MARAGAGRALTSILVCDPQVWEGRNLYLVAAAGTAEQSSAATMAAQIELNAMPPSWLVATQL